MSGRASSRGVLAIGATYALVYLFAVSVLPRPASPAVRVVLGDLFLFIPAALAAAATGRAARRSLGSERAFWLLLSTASAACAIAEILFALHEAAFAGVAGLRASAHLAYYTSVILMGVAFLVRPDRPRSPHEVRSAVLEWVMAAVGGYFLVLYFVVLPRSDARYPWFLVITVQEALPGLWALALALKVKEPPFHQVYRHLAFGLCAGAILSLWPNWLYAQGRYQVYNPWDVAWMLPFFPIVAATLGPRGAVWVDSRWSAAGDRRRARLAVLALAVPPLIDLACRAVGLQPSLAALRTELTLAGFSTLSLLVALRVRQAARPLVGRDSAESADAGATRGEPSDYLEFASGVAHELNNPLMAVAGWAELALRRGAPEPQLQGLVQATATAAAAVARLQQLVRSGRAPEAPP